jgi:hypothetical protein
LITDVTSSVALMMAFPGFRKQGTNTAMQ